jgi:FixJ family two-component response regulator
MENPFVFIVDDEPGIALLCERLLTRAGYKVAAETDPRKAIDYLRENRIDLLLVDIRMPVVDGFEVIQHAQRLQPDAAVLIMTGHGTVETAIRALRQGVDGLLLKPFSQGSELVEAVRLAFTDSQKKRDAARTQALRPLFTVTESLLSETRREPLLELIVSAMCGHLKCPQAACYQQDNEIGGVLIDRIAGDGSLTGPVGLDRACRRIRRAFAGQCQWTRRGVLEGASFQARAWLCDARSSPAPEPAHGVFSFPQG